MKVPLNYNFAVCTTYHVGSAAPKTDVIFKGKEIKKKMDC